MAAAELAANRTLQRFPNNPIAWRVKIQAAMIQGRLAQAAQLYLRWQKRYGDHDAIAYRDMALINLTHGLQVPSAAVRTSAIQLIDKHEVESLAPQVRALLASEIDSIAAAAASALLTSHPAAAPLAIELLDSRDASAQQIVIRGLAQKVGRASRAHLVPHLRHLLPSVRRTTVAAIASWAHPADRSTLLSIAKTDADGQVRSRALRSLLRYDLVPKEEIGVRGAAAMLEDSYPGVRLAAVSHLGRAPGKDADAILRQLLQSHETPIALQAAQVLYKRNPWNTTRFLQQAYATPSATARSKLLNIVPALTNPDISIALRERGLQDPVLAVRLTAARTLLYSKNFHRDALSTLQRALGSNRRRVQLQAATLLAKYGHPKGQTFLSRLATTGTPTQREAAVRAHRGLNTTTEGLIRALCDDAISVRLAASDVIFAR